MPKWSDIARFAVPVVTLFVPQLAPLQPAIMRGIDEADKLDVEDHQKREHVINIVRDAAEAAQAAGRTEINPNDAAVLAGRIIDSVDGVKLLVHELSADELVQQLPAPDHLL
jgi:hypothetical protein